MTTNTYTNLCDSVGAYEEEYGKLDNCLGCDNFTKVISSHLTGIWKECDIESDLEHWEYCDRYKIIRNYPPKSADQRERLEELILDKFRACSLNYIKTAVSGDYLIYLKGNCAEERHLVMSKIRSYALYALTHKLVIEGVLSKEEVKEALIGKR